MIKIEDLRQRFCKHIHKNWQLNNHNLPEVSAVYAMVALEPSNKKIDIVYIGSTTNIFLRYKSHKVPYKIQKMGKINLMYFLPMQKGFYDYEIKLIKKLKPLLNNQHKEVLFNG